MGKKKRLSKQERQLRHFKREAAHRQSKEDAIEKHQFDVGELVKVDDDKVGVIISHEPDLFDFKFSVNKKDFDHTTLSFLDYYVETFIQNKKDYVWSADAARAFHNVAELVSGYWDNKTQKSNNYILATIVPNSVFRHPETGELKWGNDFVMSQGTDYVVCSPRNEKQHRKMNELMIRVSELGQVEHDASLLNKDEDGKLKEMRAVGTDDSYGLGCWEQVINQMNAVAKKKSKNTGLYKVALAGGEMEGQKGQTKLVAPINISSYVA
jgi:hypothetical protein